MRPDIARVVTQTKKMADFVKSLPADAFPDPGMDADEELAWLYGRGVDDHRKLAYRTAAGSVAATPDDVVTDFGKFTFDEAVDLARALLAAAEGARND